MRSISIIFLLTITVFLFNACEETSDANEQNEEVSIKDQVAKGKVNDKSFETKTSWTTKTKFTGDNGYMIYLIPKTVNCGELEYPYVSFFIECENELSEGNYEAKGPFFHDGMFSLSYLACDVVITEVSETIIKGKVNGGHNINYVEGNFEADICSE